MVLHSTMISPFRTFWLPQKVCTSNGWEDMTFLSAVKRGVAISPRIHNFSQFPCCSLGSNYPKSVEILNIYIYIYTSNIYSIFNCPPLIVSRSLRSLDNKYPQFLIELPLCGETHRDENKIAPPPEFGMCNRILSDQTEFLQTLDPS